MMYKVITFQDRYCVIPGDIQEDKVTLLDVVGGFESQHLALFLVQLLTGEEA